MDEAEADHLTDAEEMMLRGQLDELVELRTALLDEHDKEDLSETERAEFLEEIKGIDVDIGELSARLFG